MTSGTSHSFTLGRAWRRDVAPAYLGQMEGKAP
jgi:hypothetical protein